MVLLPHDPQKEKPALPRSCSTDYRNAGSFDPERFCSPSRLVLFVLDHCRVPQFRQVAFGFSAEFLLENLVAHFLHAR